MAKDKTASGKARWYFVQRSYYYDTHDDKGNVVDHVSLPDWYARIQREWLAVGGMDMCAVIVHDKDVKDDGTIVSPHIHALIKFTNPRSASGVMTALKLTSQANSEQARDTTMAARYMLHITDNALADGKHIYSIDDVYMWVGDKTDFEVLLRKSASSPMSRYEEDTTLVDELSEQVRNGLISASQAEIKLANNGDAKMLRKYRHVFEYEQQLHLKLMAEKARTGEYKRDLTLVYVYGRGGSGKSFLADEIGKLYATEMGIHYSAVGGRSTTFDFAGNYQGERVTIANELSASEFNVRQFLSVFERHRLAVVNSRNYDKVWFADLCIITHSEAIESWIKQLVYYSSKQYQDVGRPDVALNRSSETLDVVKQARRRFKFVLHIDDAARQIVVGKLRDDYTAFDVIANVPYVAIDADHVNDVHQLALAIKEIFDAHK